MDRLGWAAKTTVTIGGYHVGIRSPSVEVDEAVRTLLREHVVDDEDSPPNFSLAFARGGDEGSAARKLHILYRGHSRVVRTRGGRKLALALLLGLGGLSEKAPPPGKVRIGTFALVRNGEAVLLSPRYAQDAEHLEPRLAGRDIRVVPGMVHTLDTERGLLVVAPGFGYDPDGLAELERLYPTPAAERAAAEPGEYRVRGWGLAAAGGGDRPSRAESVSLAARHVRGLAELDASSVLDALGHAIGHMTTWVAADDARGLEAQLMSAFDV